MFLYNKSWSILVQRTFESATTAHRKKANNARFQDYKNADLCKTILFIFPLYSQCLLVSNSKAILVYCDRDIVGQSIDLRLKTDSDKLWFLHATVAGSVTRYGDLLEFGQLFKALGNN